MAAASAALFAGCILKDDGPKSGPGLEPPITVGNPGSDGTAVPVTPAAGIGGAMGPSATAGTGSAPMPMMPGPGMAAAGTGGAAGMTAPPPAGEPSGSAGMGAAGAGGTNGGFGNPGDAGMTCETERWPALGVDQRIIAPQGDAALPDPDRCEYPLPASAAPYLPDRVNLEHTYEGQRRTVPRVATAADCNPLLGGFHYDDALNPTRIVACPATCALIVLGGAVEIVVGCPTETF